jgi:FtsZ-interacting cell division protein ZipA
METWQWVVIVIAVVALVALAVAALAARRRSDRLRDQFGSEYDRTVQRSDSKKDAELDLRERTQQREQLDVRPLSRAACERYAHEWELTQQRFVDHPAQAVAEADSLLTLVMRERGYPVDEDFDARADVISVDHPAVVEDYRHARAMRDRSADGAATTEDLREALVRYRSLFDELLVDDDGQVERSRAGGDSSHDQRR